MGEYRFCITVVLLSLQFFSNEFVSSQNLVPNPSFEEEIDFSIEYSGNWSKCLKNDTPDYFTVSNNKLGEVEQIISGIGIQPFEGNSCVGIFCYRVNPLRGVYDVREFIQIPLIESLKRDSLYDISLHLCLDKESNVAINNFNIFFSEELIQEKHERKMFEKRPQISFRKNYYDDTTWIKIENIYRANGKEKIFVFGNFKADKGTRVKNPPYKNRGNFEIKWELGEMEEAAYYYIDQVSVRPHMVKTKTIIPDPIREEADTSSEETFEIEKIDHDSPVILKNILFEFDKDILLSKSYKELNRLFNFMIINEGIRIQIEGHTDNIGSHEYNMDLSFRRAKAVADYLIQKGILSDRISWEGFGKTQPISKNETEDGRQLNRRVAFRIIEK